MKKSTMLFFVANVLAFVSYAETQLQGATTDVVTETVVQAPAPAPVAVQAPVSVTTSQTVTSADIVLPAPVPQAELIKQPTTVVEAAPLTLSKAEELRRSREETEVDTERKIVEKLEQSRIAAERKRQQEIIGAFDGAAAAESSKPVEVSKKEEAVGAVTPPAVAAAPQPQVIIVQPAPPAPPVAAEPNMSIDEVRNAVREELRASQPIEEVKAPSVNYVSANVGLLDYDSADIQTIGAMNIIFGKTFEDRWAVDFGLGYANAYVDESVFAYRKLDQVSLGLTGRFLILTGRIRPSVGAVVSYVDRRYSSLRDSTTGQSLNYPELQSSALEGGIVAAVDFMMSESLALGAEYRYVSNITHRYSDEVLNTPGYRNAYGGYVTPLEERDSQFFGFSVKYLY